MQSLYLMIDPKEDDFKDSTNSTSSKMISFNLFSFSNESQIKFCMIHEIINLIKAQTQLVNFALVRNFEIQLETQ